MSKITIDGSTTLFDLSQEWAKVYMEKKGGITIEVSHTGTTEGIRAFIDGKVDIAETSRKFTTEEIMSAKKQGLTVEGFLVGFAVYSVAVNPENSVEKLNEEEIRKIFLGEIKNWKEVGGEDREIDVIYREIGTDEYDYFLDKFLGLEGNIPDNVKIIKTPEEIVEEIGNNRGAIGYFLIHYESEKTKSLAIAKKDTDNYLKPTLDEVTVEDYPVLRPYYMYINVLSPKPLREYINFIYSDDGLKLAEKHSFEPVPIKEGQPDRDVLFEFI